LLFILLGEDDFSIRQSLEEIKKGLGDPALLSANTVALDGERLTLDELQGICETTPFLCERRLVIVSGLLGRFEPKSRSSRKKTPTSRQDDYRPLAAYVRRMLGSTVLVLVDSGISSSNPLLKELSAGAEVRSFPLLKEAKLRQWVGQRVAAEGGSISPQAVGLLARLVGGNLWAMANEINKLVLFTSGRRIDEEDVSQVVSHSQEANVFAMVDAIIESRAKVAGQLLQQLLQKGATPGYLMTMLARQVQMIIRAKELAGQRKSQGEIQKRLRLHEFALRKTLEQAARCPQPRLVEMYRRLLETDVEIKTGRCGDELALTMLVAELCG
jgi:DNA polymerase-3 subunit delta